MAKFILLAISLNIIVAVVCAVSHRSTRLPEKTYNAARKFILNSEDALLVGGKIQLTSKELKADEIIKRLKMQEFTDGLKNSSTFAPSMHFFHAKELIEASPIFKILKIMPKGAVLHGHNTAMVSTNWIIKNLTYWPDLFKCQSNSGLLLLTFRKNEFHGCTSYTRVADERTASGNATAYDIELEKSINLFTPTPESDYPDINSVWSKFQNIFTTVGDLIRFKDAFIAYTTQLLQEMYDDNIMYIEFRTSFSSIYDENGIEYNKTYVAGLMKQIVDDFSATHADFIGAKCIYSTSRNVEPSDVNYAMDVFIELHSKWPEWVMGFDLVGQEDLGKPLIDFIPELMKLPDDANYFFHAGETNWYGTMEDENLIDAFLLGAKRIGHGYAITKHPVILNSLKPRDICLEVSPISNQVLHLVHDLRNHPASILTAENIPFVISNDDPSFWNAKGLSYDFYYGFMSFSPQDAGLAYLKQLVWNSLKYSVFNDDERARAAYLINTKWLTFLDNVNANKF